LLANAICLLRSAVRLSAIELRAAGFDPDAVLGAILADLARRTAYRTL
jgi:hypothetical protein